jgi:hypothetical protein
MGKRLRVKGVLKVGLSWCAAEEEEEAGRPASNVLSTVL